MAIVSAMLFGLVITAQAQSTTIDLSLHKTVSNQSPAIGDVITYTVVVANSLATATGVVVTDQLPVDGVAYVPGSATVVRGSGTYTVATGVWNVGTIAANDSSILVLKATVLRQGVWFNTAEVTAANQTDDDSTPNNKSILEDDYAAVCFSVPIDWYPGDEYTVSVPTAFDQVVWYLNDQPISTTATSASLAVVNQDLSLTIKSPGTYRFVAYLNGCPSSNCCTISVIQGPYGSLGDQTYVDTNGDGVQQPGEPVLAGVAVTLVSNGSTVTTTTSSTSGIYSFTGLTPGVPYSVSFTSPTGYTATTYPSGIAPVVNLSAGETNLSIDAGFRQAPAPAAVYDLSMAKTVVSTGPYSPGGNVTYQLTVTNNSNRPVYNVVVSDNLPTGTSFVSGAGFTTSGVNSVSALLVGPLAVGAISSLTLTLGISSTYASASMANLGTVSRFTTASAITGPAGVDTTPANNTAAVSVAVGAINPQGNGDPGMLGSQVFVDLNGDGIQQSDEPALGGVISTLISNGTVVATTTADADGVYSFTGLTPGIPYSVSFTSPAGFTATTYAGGVSPIVILTDGEINMTINAGFQRICPTNFNLVASADGSICQGDSIRLTASTPVQGGSIKWYLTPTDGVAFATLTSGQFVTVKPTITTVYYVEVSTSDGCHSLRKPVSVTVTTVPTPICPSNLKNVCPAKTVDLTKIQIENLSTALTYEWYTSLTRSQPTRVTNLTAVGAGKLYLFAKSVSNCYSNPAIITVEIADCTCPSIAGVSVGPDITVCAGDVVPLKAVLSGSATSAIWASAGTGTFSDPASLTAVYTPSLADIARGTVQLNILTNDPDGSGGVCVAGTSSLIVSVSACLADLAVLKQVVTPGPYSVGQKITYSITATNNSAVVATGVSVRDVLPASLTYISSTPAGEYNSGTGIWTIGTLTKGTSRTLLIDATIRVDGSVRNTAAITGSNNNPKLTQNDTSSVVIETTQMVHCATQPPLITCAITEICQDGSTTLQTAGCEGGIIKWSDGQSGVTVSVSPKLTTTYSASCVMNGCTSQASNPISVTVLAPKTPVITASSPGNVCPGTSVTLTASGCVGGTIEWSEGRQTGASIVVIPFSKTTYTAQCRLGSCLSNPAAKTIDMGTALPVPTIVCSTTIVCPGEAVTLTINGCVGTPVWSSTTQTTGSIIVTPTLASNTYSVYCQNSSCTSKSSPVYSISVAAPVTPVVTASTDSVCVKGLVSLTATGCNGTVIWNAADKNGVSLTGTVIKVYPDANISYYAQCRFRTCLSDPSVVVPVTVVSPSAPIIKTDKSMVCSGEKLTLTAQGCTGGIITWYGVNRTGASITLYPTETKEYYATCKQATCESDASNKIRVTVTTTGTAPTIVASTTAVCSGAMVSLTATGCAGSVIWSDGQTGSVVSVTATPANPEFYALCKIGTACGSGKSNIVNLKVTSTPTPTVTCSTTVVCPGEKVTLTVNNCQGTPYWNTKETTRSIIVSPVVSTSYSVYCQDGVCKSASSGNYMITVVPVPAPTMAASATAVEPGGTVSLSATGCPGQVIWSANDINGNNKGAVIVVRPEGTQTYSAQCRFRECLSDPSISITINKGGAGQATDLSITKTVSSTSVKSGDIVTYTLKVQNLGPVAATNVEVGDILPKGLAIVSVPLAGYTFANGAVTKIISRIAPGKSDSVVFSARVMAKGLIANMADIVKYDQKDTNPGNNWASVTIMNTSANRPSLVGLSKSVLGTPKAIGDSLIKVSYSFVVTNFGDDTLRKVQVIDDLAYSFVPNTILATVVTPQVTGSTLALNPAFTGMGSNTGLFSPASYLTPGNSQFFTLDVLVKRAAGSTIRSFKNIASVTAQNSVTAVYDLSVDGGNSDPDGDGDPTNNTSFSSFTLGTGQVRTDLPKGLLGVAKAAGKPTRIEEGVYDIPYTIIVSNLGSVPLKKVQVVDNLSQTFSHGALIVSNQVSVTANAGLTVNPYYTGQGLITKMLVDSLSNLPVGATNRLTFTVRVNVKNADTLKFYNTATATALTPGNEVVEDKSAAGLDADPDNDLDPRNNGLPTPVSLISQSPNAFIGVAMAVRDTARQTDGSFNVTYQIVLKNYGREPLTNVSLTDSLSNVFNASTGSAYSIVRAPFTTSTGCVLKLNPAFNGASDSRVVLGDSISALAAGKVDTILVRLNILTDGSTTTFLNSALAKAKAGILTVSDISTSGLNPDLNGNRNPTDQNEREPTPLSLPSTNSALFIPQGFSPNGDGINDRFVIRGAGSHTISLEVYNRWSHMVYKNDDYRNDWDGKPNTGMTVGQDASGLPDGTYYYVVRTSDGHQFVRYLTLNR